MKIIPIILTAVALAALPVTARSGEPAPKIVAAENFYGDMARQIAGPDASIDSILTNPNQDPHDFEASPSTARLIADASLVIYNGADYDPWIESLLKASKSANRRTIVAAELMNRKSGDNPHLWYDPATMPRVAQALAAELGRADPGHKTDYENRLQAYLASLKPLSDKIDELKQKYGAIDVTATEPVFGYMAKALGFKMRNESFQIKVMNGTEPSASDVAAFEDDLKKRKVKVLFYNSQVTDDLTGRLQKLAKDSKVPVVGVSETEPAGSNFQDWMLDQLVALDRALAGAGS
jgi:zinc/manganese transport system substrate-binding protein